MLSETLPTGDPSSSVRVNIARLTLQLRALRQEAADAEAAVAGSTEETARAELRARLEPLLAQRRAELEHALRAAQEEAAAQIAQAHQQVAGLQPTSQDPVSEVQELVAQIDAARARAAAARERTLLTEAEVRVALNEELTVARNALAVIEHEHELAITALRKAAQLEVDRILGRSDGNPRGDHR